MKTPYTFSGLKTAAMVITTLLLIGQSSKAQVGIGTTQPQEMLHVFDGSVLATTPELPADSDPFWDPNFPYFMKYTLEWYHGKSALRAMGERVGTGSLESQNIGPYSFASGYENFATGIGATAFGLRCSANGKAALATGYQAHGSGLYSFAAGTDATANGSISVAMGEMVSTNNQNNSFVFGAGVNQVLKNDKSYQMMMGFSGGYKFYTNNAATIGVQLSSGGNSWSVISDVNKKENFAPINGEDFLKKFASLHLTSWNYKGQDPKTFRHYGPMAQDFFKAFGKDAFGTIGTDTTINQADFDGVNMIAIQAIIRKMEKMNNDLLVEIATIKAQLAAVQSVADPGKKKVLYSKK